MAPNPVTNAEFTRELARAVRRPALLPARVAELGHHFCIESLERALEAELR